MQGLSQCRAPGCSQVPSPEEQGLRLSQGELEQGQGFSQGELELGLRQGEDPEDHHNRHVTGLLPHPAKSLQALRLQLGLALGSNLVQEWEFSNREQGPERLPLPAK